MELEHIKIFIYRPWQFVWHNLPADFSLNKTDIVCHLPCQAYCGRDSVLVSLMDSPQGPRLRTH